MKDHTRISVATRDGNIGIIREMIDSGISPDVVHREGATTTLWDAALTNKLEIANLLLEYNANPNVQSPGGWSPLICAANKGYLDMVQLLVQHGANVELGDERGATALVHARNNGHSDVVHFLSSCGAARDVKVMSNSALTAKVAGDIVGGVFGLIGGLASVAVNALNDRPVAQASQDRADLKENYPNTESEEQSLTPLLGELNSLVGLDNVKSDVARHISLLRVQRMRREKGLSVPEQSLHMVFSGNPGTGKTSIARLLAKIYKQMGILSKGQFVETDRAGLVAEYVGQTAPKVQTVVKKAIGGILFIDEAYTLSGNERGGDQYGQEAIDTLLKLMEDHRRDLIVIVAGYTEPMQRFIESNPGLQSRFNKYLHFEDYSPDDLTSIFTRLAKQHDYELTAAAQAKVASVFQQAYQNRTRTFGNARLLRNLFEKAISDHAMRIGGLPDVSESDLITIAAEDIQQ